MKRPATAILVAAVVFGATLIGVTAARRASREAPCGPGFVRRGPRCLPPPDACPAPLVAEPQGCVAPEPSRIDVPATTVTIGPSDWEAEGRLSPRVLRVSAFRIDAFEVTVGRACASKLFAGASFCADDPARAAYGITLSKARAFCAEAGGRLPSEDEWIVAAAGDRPRRYPWGDTGAVCRRAAWGLRDGPCASGVPPSEVPTPSARTRRAGRRSGSRTSRETSPSGSRPAGRRRSGEAPGTRRLRRSSVPG